MATPEPFAPVLAAPDRSAVFVDFDGSLARIVDDPATARPLPAAITALEALVGAVGRVGVISGRPMRFLQRALPVPGLALAGLYGMEFLVGDEVVVDPAVRPYVGRADRAADDAERSLPGLTVERKSDLSCVIHWRPAPDREDEAVAVGREIAARHGLAARAGRMALEICPPVEVDKGTAIERLADGFAVIVFAGDDLGDLDAFEAIDRLVGSGRAMAGVKIAVRSAEAPDELLARADERVNGPDELAAVLAGLARDLTSSREG